MEAGTWNFKIKHLQEVDEYRPPPTREEELAYLDQLQAEFRGRSYRQKKFIPDPARKFDYSVDQLERYYYKRDWRRYYLGCLLVSPLAMLLTHMSPAKVNLLGVPYRSYPMQHRIRFWTFFTIYEFSLAKLMYYFVQDKKIPKKFEYPVFENRPPKL